MAIFAKNMKAERLSRNMSQEKLSKISGVSQQAISMIEAEKRSPTEETMSMIATGLDCTIRYLLSDHHEIKLEAEEFTPIETQLLTTYRSLTPQGQEYIRQQLEIAKKIYGQFDSVSLMAPGMINE